MFIIFLLKNWILRSLRGFKEKTRMSSFSKCHILNKVNVSILLADLVTWSEGSRPREGVVQRRDADSMVGACPANSRKCNWIWVTKRGWKKICGHHHCVVPIPFWMLLELSEATQIVKGVCLEKDGNKPWNGRARFRYALEQIRLAACALCAEVAMLCNQRLEYVKEPGRFDHKKS